MSTNTSTFKSTEKERRYRRFSESFKRKRVKELEEGRATVREICKAYEVTDTSVYKWKEKYSMRSKPERTIVESKSDNQKIVEQQKKIAELERMVGQQQVKLMFQEKMMEIAEKEYGIDFKKKSNS